LPFLATKSNVASTLLLVWTGFKRYTLSSCVSPSVCLSVTHRYCIKTAKRRITQTTPFCYGDDTTVDYVLDCSVPQRSVLGAQQFSAYTSDIPSVFMRHTVRFHLYADDKQAYASGRVSDVDNIRRVRERHCSLVLVSSRLLQLNSAKTEAIWFRSHANLSKLTTCDLSVTVNNDNFSPAHSVRDLGVILDDETEHEAACQQPSENLLLSSSPSTPGLPSSWI